ncbi:MAG TPA: hypothetical protein VEZ15_03600, partial [Acidimicrobiia bacterium]|nr:hypothetical protein [Acidimicrobiia bacterium]
MSVLAPGAPLPAPSFGTETCEVVVGPAIPGADNVAVVDVRGGVDTGDAGVVGTTFPLTVKVFGQYIVSSDCNPPLTQVAVTSAAAARAPPGILKVPRQAPLLFAGTCTLVGGIVPALIITELDPKSRPGEQPLPL